MLVAIESSSFEQTSNRRLSTITSLRVARQPADSGWEWLSISKDSNVPQDKFDWPSGANVTVHFTDNSANPQVSDWYIYPGNKSFDSRERAYWRRIVFLISLVLLSFSVFGAVLEAIEKYREKTETFSPQRCLELLIASIEGKDKKESQHMRTALQKILLEGEKVNDTIASLKLGPTQQRIFWIKTAGRFRTKLTFLIAELNRYLSRL